MLSICSFYRYTSTYFRIKATCPSVSKITILTKTHYVVPSILQTSNIIVTLFPRRFFMIPSISLNYGLLFALLVFIERMHKALLLTISIFNAILITPYLSEVTIFEVLFELVYYIMFLGEGLVFYSLFTLVL